MHQRRRLDDATAILDWIVAHGILCGSIVIIAVSLAIPGFRAALRPAAIVGVIATARLIFHPLRFARLSRVWIEKGSVHVAPVLGRERAVQVARVEHDGHAPWPVTLHMTDGTRVQFVARRDSGYGAFFDLEPSDRARYERPSEARDSISDLEILARR